MARPKLSWRLAAVRSASPVPQPVVVTRTARHARLLLGAALSAALFACPGGRGLDLPADRVGLGPFGDPGRCEVGPDLGLAVTFGDDTAPPTSVATSCRFAAWVAPFAVGTPEVAPGPHVWVADLLDLDAPAVVTTSLVAEDVVSRGPPALHGWWLAYAEPDAVVVEHLVRFERTRLTPAPAPGARVTVRWPWLAWTAALEEDGGQRSVWVADLVAGEVARASEVGVDAWAPTVSVTWLSHLEQPPGASEPQLVVRSGADGDLRLPVERWRSAPGASPGPGTLDGGRLVYSRRASATSRELALLDLTPLDDPCDAPPCAELASVTLRLLASGTEPSPPGFGGNAVGFLDGNGPNAVSRVLWLDDATEQTLGASGFAGAPVPVALGEQTVGWVERRPEDAGALRLADLVALRQAAVEGAEPPAGRDDGAEASP